MSQTGDPTGSRGVTPPLSPEEGLAALTDRMRAADMPEVAIRCFAAHYRQLRAGHRGLLPESEIRPVEALPDAETLPDGLADRGRAEMGRLVVIKLNGGLGTSMGMRGPKSLLPVRDGRSFLELIAASCAAAGVPLLLMNSFSTRAESLAALDGLALASPGGRPGLPRDFLQHQVPKVCAETLGPIAWPRNPALEWCPPGHGDIYPALLSSGALAALRGAGFEWAFVSNADNLGAVPEPTLLGYLAEERVPFLMEVADRTPADRKGGHLAQRPDGGLLLRERAQVPPDPEAIAQFEDVGRHRYFNTNNLWLHLPTLERLLAKSDGVLGLPLIVNRKTVDPRDPESPPVLQLESAMGAALSVVPGARAVRVSRRRFAPVKTTEDLLAVRSDAYALTADFRVVPNPDRPTGLAPLDVRLDPRFYRLVEDLDARFPEGPPSLLGCAQFEVRGDVRFGRGVVCRGAVQVEGPEAGQAEVPDGAVLAGRVVLPSAG